MATDARTGRPSTAADLMTPSPRTCSPFSTVLEAVMIFRDADCGAVPVVDVGTPVGILTDRDVALALAEYPDLAGRSVEEVMTRETVTVAPDTPLDQLKTQFATNGVRRLLVADKSGQLVGIVSLSDVAPHLSDQDVGDIVTHIIQPTT